MREKAFAFGAEGGLVGVLTEPASEEQLPGAPAVLFSNVGLNHRVGPFRLYVELARSLASVGFTAFRFDLSGLGDSEPRRDARTELERAAVDTREAIEFVAKKKGIERFVLIGLCSGVDSVHSVSLAEPRVVGAVHLDGYAYRTRAFYLRRYTVRFLQARLWKLYIERKLRRLMPATRAERREVGDAPEIYNREYPTRPQLEHDLSLLLERGVKLLFLYSGGNTVTYNYRDQFYDMFQTNFRGRIEVQHHARADHTYSVMPDRARLIKSLCQWMQAHYDGKASGARA
jgi:pimeloyl-ACP methyl ester carboxylesterase